MTIEAYIENGQIVLSSPLKLPNGTKVTGGDAKKEDRRTINDRLRDVIGKAEGLPADFAENHDHYLHGTAKKADS